MLSDNASMPTRSSHQYVRNLSTRLTEDVRNGSTKCSCPEVTSTENLRYSSHKRVVISVTPKNRLHPRFSKMLHKANNFLVIFLCILTIVETKPQHLLTRENHSDVLLNPCHISSLSSTFKPNDTTLKNIVKEIAEQVDTTQNLVRASTRNYIDAMFSKHYSDFFEEWKNTYTPEWLQEFPQSHFHNEFNRVNEAKKLKDARLLYTALTKQLYTRYARIYYYLDLLKHVETSDGVSIETDSTRIANNSRKQIRVNLKQILCEIYAYLTVNDSNFQIQSIIDHNNVNITRNADNDKEDIYSGIVYVDLIHTLNNFYHFTKTFVEMH